MKCPHCRTAFHYQGTNHSIGLDIDAAWMIKAATCPSCLRLIISLVGEPMSPQNRGGRLVASRMPQEIMCRPKASLRPAPAKDVPEVYANDYVEACLVISDSPKASAALSRRCLQNILRDVAKVKPNNLAREIQEVIDGRNLPSHLSEAVDGIRNIGNFAAHPTKSKSTGEIVEVEAGEAEWNLDVLEGLFDFYFVQPAALKDKRDALNTKLKDAGKPEMKDAAA